MYSTCLFCKTSLGRNDVLEHFPVGRRLAYHTEKGRLWVVCKRCERWNLTPLDVRWEALEEAERAFRSARRRIATDNIALARPNDRLELVRIGAPPRLELATWRYGDQFGRRHRKHLAYLSVGAVAAVAPLAVSIWGGIALATVGATVVRDATDWRRWRREKRVPRVFVHDLNGNQVGLTERDIWTASLSRVPEAQDWALSVKHAKPPFPRYGSAFADTVTVNLRGEDARHALAFMLPYINKAGASARHVRDAVEVITASSNVEQLIYTAAPPPDVKGWNATNYVNGLPARVRLALEMALHEDDERRAMEGELATLEQRWRDADEIASVADSLLVPKEVEARLQALQQRNREIGVRPRSPGSDPA